MSCERCGSTGQFCIVAEIIPGLPLCEFCTKDVEHYIKNAHTDTAHSAITRSVLAFRKAK